MDMKKFFSRSLLLNRKTTNELKITWSLSNSYSIFSRKHWIMLLLLFVIIAQRISDWLLSQVKVSWAVHLIVVERIRLVMKKLSFALAAAKLREYTHLRAKCSNATRWSSTSVMLTRYLEIKEFLPELDIEDLDGMLPTAREVKSVEKLCAQFKDLDAVTKKLQSEDVS